MAKNTGTKAGETTASASEKSLWDRFAEIQTDRYMYNPNKGSEGPLVGHLVNLLEMPPIKVGNKTRDWQALLIQITEKASVIDRNGDVILVEPGSEVLIPGTYQILQNLRAAAIHEKLVFEVAIQPKEKVDIGGSQTMWTYRLGVSKAGPKERLSFGPSALLGEAARKAALPAAFDTRDIDDEVGVDGKPLAGEFPGDVPAAG